MTSWRLDRLARSTACVAALALLTALAVPGNPAAAADRMVLAEEFTSVT